MYERTAEVDAFIVDFAREVAPAVRDRAVGQ
jgi:hypothetical protein